MYKMTPQQFKQIRKDLKLTQEELALMMGRKQRMVRNYELGSHKIPLIVENILSLIKEINS